MGISCLSTTIFLFTPISSKTLVGGSGQIGQQSIPISSDSYENILKNGNLPQLNAACIDSAQFSMNSRLRELTRRLVEIAEPVQTSEFLMDKANAFLSCKDANSAQKLLSQNSPPEFMPKRRAWWILSWQAANSAMNHDEAALALRKLSNDNFAELEKVQLEVGDGEDGITLTRSALDMLAEHERSSGNWSSSAQVLMSGRTGGVVGARRIALASQLMENLDSDQRKTMFAKALDQAMSDKAWWLVEDILRLQLLWQISQEEDVKPLIRNIERLAVDLDDSYTLLEILRKDYQRKEETVRLEDKLRAPSKDALPFNLNE